MHQIDQTKLSLLKKRLNKRARIITELEECSLYQRDLGEVPSWFEKALFNTMPDIVIQPFNSSDVSEILKFANEENVPVVPRGCASWGFGGSVPIIGGIVIDVSPMRKIIHIDPNNMIVRVQSGARWSDIDSCLEKHGLSLMSYSSSKFTTVVGWIVTGGIGINSFRFGHVREQIESIEVVLPDGKIRTLSPGDKEFLYFIGTEGQMGVITEVALKIKKRSRLSCPRLFYFDSTESAFNFVEKVVCSGLKPNHIGYIDPVYLSQVNRVREDKIVEERPAVLIHFDDEFDEDKLKLVELVNGFYQAPDYQASYLWHERLFTMAIKRLGPKILAGEALMPIKKAADFIEKVDMLGKNFGTEISFEGHLANESEIVLMCFFLSGERQRLRYVFHMALAGMIGKLSIKNGGKPYGLGVWNLAFAKEKYGKGTLEDYRQFKKEIDPKGTLNPSKAFSEKITHLFLARLFLSPLFFSNTMSLLIKFSRLVGFFAKLSNRKRSRGSESLMERAVLECSRCGSCLSVCPAYLVTNDEAVTARAKLSLAKKIIDGKHINVEFAKKAFLCLHCKACENICQSELPLIKVWEELEAKLKDMYGWPNESIEDFMVRVDESKDYWKTVNDL